MFTSLDSNLVGKYNYFAYNFAALGADIFAK